MKVNCYGTVRTHGRDMPPDFGCGTLKLKKVMCVKHGGSFNYRPSLRQTIVSQEIFLNPEI